MKVTREKVVDDLLWPIWLGMDNAFKMENARKIWEYFEDSIRSASYTDSLKVFLTNIQRRMKVEIDTEHLDSVREIIDSGEDEALLNYFREETAYLVVLVRLKNQERKEEWANR